MKRRRSKTSLHIILYSYLYLWSDPSDFKSEQFMFVSPLTLCRGTLACIYSLSAFNINVFILILGVFDQHSCDEY